MKNGNRNINEILTQLDDIAKDDIKHRTGKIFGYTYNASEGADELVEKAYVRYMNENALDPVAFPGTKNLEKEVISETLKIINGVDTCEGVFTAGGTESILMALRSARELFKGKGYKRVLIPVTAHPASLKACDYLGLEPVILPVDNNYKLTSSIVKEYLTKDTICVVASAPSYGTGIIDDIEDIGDLLFGTGIQFVVDACMGGMVLPFTKNEKKWDFRVDGVTAICLDFHKFGYSAKGSSGVFYRDGKKMKELQAFTCSNWMGYSIVNTTSLNTKSGGPVAATWAIMNYLGKDGYTEIVERVLNAVEYLKININNIPEVSIVGKPEVNLLSFTSDVVDIFSLSNLMKSKGWYLQIQYKFSFNGITMPETIHLTVGNSNVEMVELFIQELKESIQELKSDLKIKDLNANMNTIMNEIPYNLRDSKLMTKVLDEYSVNSI